MTPGGERAPIAVIGAGIVGVSSALFLQRDDHDVLLIDHAEPGSGTSSGNAGIIDACAVEPLVGPATLCAVPGMLMRKDGWLAIRWRHIASLSPWLVRFALNCRPQRARTLAEALVALTMRALQPHDILIQQCGAGDLVRSTGWLKVTRDRETLMRATAHERHWLARHGSPFEVVEGAELHALEPALAPGVAAGLWLEGLRSLSHSQAYTERLFATFVERGGRFLRAAVRHLVPDDGRIARLETEEGSHAVRAVVLAAGAFSGTLLRGLGINLPLEAERGYHLMLPHPEPPLRRPVLSLEHGFVMTPMRHGLRLTSGVELASREAPPNYRIPERLLPLARGLVPGLEPRIESRWLGFRPSLPDMLPAIGRFARFANLYAAFGHQHLGLTLGPLTGRLIADLIAERDPGLDLSPYRPDRRFV